MKQRQNKYTKMLRELRHKYIVRNAAEEVNRLVLASPIVMVNLTALCTKIALLKKLKPNTVLKCYRRHYKANKASHI